MTEYQKLLEQIEGVAKGTFPLDKAYCNFWEKTVYLKNEERFTLAEKLSAFNEQDPRAPAWQFLSQGECHVFAGNYLNAIDISGGALELFQKLEEKGGIMSANTMLGLAYRSIGQLDKAQDHVQAALQAAEELKPGTIYDYLHNVTYYQAGELNNALQNHEKAIELFNRGLEVIYGNPETVGRMYTGLGNAYMHTAQWEKALHYFNLSLDTIRHIDNYMLESKNYADIGSYYFKKGDVAKALENQEKSLKIRLEHNLLNPAVTNYIQLAELYFSQDNPDKAIQCGEQAVAQAMKGRVLIKLPEAHNILAKIYDKKGEIEKAYQHFKLYHKFREEVFNQETVRKMEQLNTQHKVEMMSQEKEIFRLRNIELKAALDEITESFRYAKRIQHAILPSDHLFKKHFPESFILYKPKDIVAGDFYWLDESEGKILFAACDCTGHGVPGAMVSVVCHNALNRAIKEFGKRDPASILDKTRELVIAQFNKSDEEVKDGMDAVLCMLDTSSLHLSYAAANNSFYIVRENKLLVSEADKMPVGKFTDELNSFSLRNMELRKNDVLYIFSDGYADQFGGEKGKKFKYKPFQEKLMEVHKRPMNEQKDILDETIENWKGNMEQTDDILVIGIKV